MGNAAWEDCRPRIHGSRRVSILPTCRTVTSSGRPLKNERQGEVTRLANRWAQGDRDALDQLIDLVYDDLRRIAHRQITNGWGGGETVNTTGLVHEAFVKLAGGSSHEWLGRGQFYAFCAKAMRRILIDSARARGADKRGGGRVRVPLTPGTAAVDPDVLRILAVDEALKWLEDQDQRLAAIAECRFFGGLSVEETGEALGVSARTIEREWARARGYLYRRLNPETGVHD
jgi:RNA polymerase sigma-70 factor, ECF subfamily